MQRNVTKSGIVSSGCPLSLHFVTPMLYPSIFVTHALFSLHPVAACAPWLFKTPGLASNLQGIAEERPSPCCNENPDLPEAAQMQKNIQNPLTPVSTLLRFRYSMPEAAPQRCPGRCWRARAFSKATERTHSLRVTKIVAV